MSTNIGDIAETVPCISQSEKNKVVDKIFNENSELQGIVVVNNDKPIGLITRTHFYQRIGTLYGYNLFMGRSVELLAKGFPLTVDYLQPITEVSKLAMERNPEDLYDYVIVTKDDKFLGIVSIQKLLMKLVEVQVEVASLLNPLTGLPGNHIIDNKLKGIMEEDRYSIIYFDLDNFKAYNDTYGFKKGDQLLRAFADLLRRNLQRDGVFLGHIGGDDFIAVQNDYDLQLICNQIINEFNSLIKQFYSPKHLAQQYIVTENREGKKDKISLVSLSIAIVTNQNLQFKDVEELVEYVAVVKKKCKAFKGSCCFIN